MFIRHSNQARKQTGDTIVEVLIAIAIVSLVLAGAYASTNHNVAATQDTQEHAQALQLVQSQVEFMRAGVAAGVAVPTSCYKSDGAVATTPATDCVVNRAGVSGCTTEPCYTLAISPPVSGVYSVTAQWASLIGSASSKANVTLYYRP